MLTVIVFDNHRSWYLQLYRPHQHNYDVVLLFKLASTEQLLPCVIRRGLIEVLIYNHALVVDLLFIEFDEGCLIDIQVFRAR